MIVRREERATRLWLAVILVLAAVVRLHNIDFGLPSLWDDDEPFFLMHGIKLLKNQTLDPGWFGHPGSTTIYGIAGCAALVYGIGFLFGAWANSADFIAAIYADPRIIMVPERLMIVIPGIISVLLVYLIGKRIRSPFAGLAAAAFLALSPLHIDLSQLIRTDVQMTMLVLWSVYAALPLTDQYSRRALLSSAVLAGVASATKWPGMAVLLVPIVLTLVDQQPWGAKLRRVGTATVAAVVGLLAASPFVAISYETVLHNVSVEGRPRHLSQTSGGLVDTLSAYLFDVIPSAFGWPIAVGAALGVFAALSGRLGSKKPLPILLPLLTFLIVISIQSIMWPRWAVPVLPFVALFAALFVDLSRPQAERLGKGARAVAMTAVGSLLLIPLGLGAWRGAQERSHDTRDQAVEWIEAHAGPQHSVALETPAIALIKGDWGLRFPLGDLGCVDPRSALADRIDYDGVASATKGRININLGTIPSDKIATCRADFIMVNELDRYLAEARDYPDEVATYRQLLSGMREVATFVPVPGRSGGPIVRIYARELN